MVARTFSGKAATSSQAYVGNVLRTGGTPIGPGPGPGGGFRNLAAKIPTSANAKAQARRAFRFSGKAAMATGATANPTQGQVDLVVDAISASPTAPTAGQLVTFTVTVRNQSSIRIPAGVNHDPNIGVGIYLDGVVPPGAPITYTNYDAGLAGGASFTLSTTTGWAPGGAWAATEGTHTITAIANDQRTFLEGNFDNNSRAMTLVVDPVPSGGGGGTPPTGFRLYANTSPWNTVKSSAGPFFAGADGVLSTQTYGLNNDAFSHPFYVAQATDPAWTVNQTANNWGNGPRTVTIHAPNGIAPASGSDSVMSILDIDGHLWDFYGVGGGVNQATHTISVPVLNDGDGINGRGFQAIGAGGFRPPGTSISGAPQASGTILASDVANGKIEHGLFMAFDCAQLGSGASGTNSVVPAMPGIDDIGGCPGLLPEGALLLAVGTEPAGLNAMEHQLWLACTTYGVYICDRLGGHPQFYGDRSNAVGSAFTGTGLTAIGQKLRLVRTW